MNQQVPGFQRLIYVCGEQSWSVLFDPIEELLQHKRLTLFLVERCCDHTAHPRAVSVVKGGPSHYWTGAFTVMADQSIATALRE